MHILNQAGIERRKSLEAEEMVLDLLEKGDSQHISDIHLIPEGLTYGCYFRRNGQLEVERRYPKAEGQRIIGYIKFLGNMDVGEKRRPQSGSAVIQMEGQPKDLRFSTMTNFKQEESLVIRLLNKSNQLDIEHHTFFKKQMTQLKQLVRYRSGLLLFSGSVGSGKTTTMYHLVREYALEENQQVITVEDPVEMEEPSFLQCQVNEKAGTSYDTLLKASLRHHPDILIVGEIRDEETARMVIRGALTGHLILASVHSKHAEGVIERIKELGISDVLLRQTVVGIVYQNLLPQACPLCVDNCSKYCTHLSPTNKRAALFDVWEGEKLHNLLYEETEKLGWSGSTSFNDQLRKVWAYGYITNNTYQKFYIP